MPNSDLIASQTRLIIRNSRKFTTAGFLQSLLSSVATGQDKSVGKEFVIEVRRGDLVLSDMGYFSVSEFTAIEQLGAWRLTCPQWTTSVMLGEKKVVALMPGYCWVRFPEVPKKGLEMAPKFKAILD